jgi:hypothetical protein
VPALDTPSRRITFVQNSENMTAQQARKSINQVLNGVADPAVLEAYYQILVSLMKIDADGRPFAQADLEKEVAAASKRVKAGKFVRHAALKQQIKDW